MKIAWGMEEIDQYFNGAKIITEFKQPGRNSIKEENSWRVFLPGTTAASVRYSQEGDDFIRKARQSWLLEVRTYRQEGLPSGSFHFDLRGLTDLFDQHTDCKR